MRILNVIISGFPFSCSSKQKNPAFDETMIQIISENPICLKNTGTLPLYASCNFFVRGGNGKILLLEPKDLEEIYYEDYSFLNYKRFVRKALNQNLIIKTKNKGIVFELDKKVTDIYRNTDFSDFLKIYCVNSQEINKFWLKSNIQDEQLFSIFYYFFINNYLTEFDDYMGNYYLSGTSNYSNRAA